MNEFLVPGGEGAKSISEGYSDEDKIEESLLTENEESEEEKQDVEMIEVKEEFVKKEDKQMIGGEGNTAFKRVIARRYSHNIELSNLKIENNDKYTHNCINSR